MDSIASLVIFNAKAAFDIFRDAMNKLVDCSCDAELENEMREYILKNENILGIDLLHTRVFGNKIYIGL